MPAAKSKASGSKNSNSKSRPPSTSQLSAPAPDRDVIDEDESAASTLKKKAKLSKGLNGSASTTQRYTEAGRINAQRNGITTTAAGVNGLLTGPDDIALLTDDQANLDTNIDDLNEPTLGQRLKGMKVGARLNGTTRASDEGEDDDEEDADRIAIPQGSLSLGQTLTQALHSNDAALLSSCLAHSDPAVIRSSVSKLSGPLSVKLLEHCVDRMGRGGKRSSGALGSARTRGIIEWIRATLIIHTGYLMSIPNLVHRLSALHATLSGRLAAHERLLALNGRLELVLGQIEMRAAYTAEQARKVQGVRAKAKSNGTTDIQAQKKAQMEGQVWVEESSDEEADDHALNGMQVDEDDQSSDELDDVVRGEEEGIVQDIALGNDTLGNTSVDSEDEEAEAGSDEDIEMSGDEESQEDDDDDDEDDEEDDDESALDEEGDSDAVEEEEEEDSEDGRGGLLDLEAESTDGDEEEEGSEEE